MRYAIAKLVHSSFAIFSACDSLTLCCDIPGTSSGWARYVMLLHHTISADA